MRMRFAAKVAFLVVTTLGPGANALAQESPVATPNEVRGALEEPADPDDADDIRDDDNPNDVGQEALPPAPPEAPREGAKPARPPGAPGAAPGNK